MPKYQQFSGEESSEVFQDNESTQNEALTGSDTFNQSENLVTDDFTETNTRTSNGRRFIPNFSFGDGKISDFLTQNHFLILVWFLIIAQMALLIWIGFSSSAVEVLTRRVALESKPDVETDDMTGSQALLGTRIKGSESVALMNHCMKILCPESEHVSGCFCFSSREDSWENANKSCEENFESMGGRLAVLDTQGKISLADSLIKEYSALAENLDTKYHYRDRSFWLGARSSKIGFWKWVNGRTTSLEVFESETVIDRYLGINGAGLLTPVDGQPSRNLDVGFLCEKKGISGVTIGINQKLKDNETCQYYGKGDNSMKKACDSLGRNGVQHQAFCEAKLNDCYVYLYSSQLKDSDRYSRPRKWMDTRKYCIEDLGMNDLASFNDEREYNFVSAKIKKYISVRDTLWIGGTKVLRDSLKEWYWVDMDSKEFGLLDPKLWRGASLDSKSTCLSLTKHDRNQYTFPQWFGLSTSHCNEAQNYICEFTPKEAPENDAGRKLSSVKEEAYKVLHVFSTVGDHPALENWYFIPREPSTQQDIMATCNYVTNHLRGETFSALTTVIRDEDHKKKIIEALNEISADLKTIMDDDDMLLVDTKYNANTGSLGWSRYNATSLDLNYLLPAENAPGVDDYERYRDERAADSKNVHVGFVMGTDGEFELKAYNYGTGSRYYHHRVPKMTVLCSTMDAHFD